jgi:hypothetical protein
MRWVLMDILIFVSVKLNNNFINKTIQSTYNYSAFFYKTVGRE